MERFHSALDLVPLESNLVTDFSMSNKQVKALMNELGITPHLTLQARLAAKLEELKAHVPKESGAKPDQ